MARSGAWVAGVQVVWLVFVAALLAAWWGPMTLDPSVVGALLAGAFVFLAWLVWPAVRVILGPTDDGLERVVLYDGECGFCTRWMAWARRHAHAGLRYEPCRDQSALRRRAGITDAQCGESAFLVASQAGAPRFVLIGAAAVNGAMERFRGARNLGWRFVAVWYRMPIVRQIENAGYRWVARNRHRFGSGACTVEEMRRRAQS